MFRKNEFSIVSLVLLATASFAAFAAPGATAPSGGMSGAHISSSATIDSNGPNAQAKEMGTTRATDKMSASGMVDAKTHTKTKNQAKTPHPIVQE